MAFVVLDKTIFGIWCESGGKGSWLMTSEGVFYSEYRPLAAIKMNELIDSNWDDLTYRVALIGDDGKPIFERANS